MTTAVAVNKFAQAGIDKRATRMPWGHAHAGRVDGGSGGSGGQKL